MINSFGGKRKEKKRVGDTHLLLRRRGRVPGRKTFFVEINKKNLFEL
jgi:hypothetical protein